MGGSGSRSLQRVDCSEVTCPAVRFLRWGDTFVERRDSGATFVGVGTQQAPRAIRCDANLCREYSDASPNTCHITPPLPVEGRPGLRTPLGRTKTDRVLPSLREAESRSGFDGVVKEVVLVDSVELGGPEFPAQRRRALKGWCRSRTGDGRKQSK